MSELQSKTFVARLKYRGKPYSMQILAKSIDKNNAMMSIAKLEMHNTKYSVAMAKLLKSCINNAQNQGYDAKNLVVTDLSIGRGEFLRRRGFKGRGRTELIKKPNANMFLKMEYRS